MNEGRIKVWGRKDSSNVQKVLWCCGELDLAFERLDIGGAFGGNKEASYLSLNPNGLVPTVEHEGFVLWESNSIVRYLIDKYGEGRLTPSTPEARASANRWMDWQLTTLGPAMVPLFWGLIRTPAEKRNPASIEQALKKSITVWDILNAHLAQTPFVVGDDISFGDIPLGVWAYRWFNLPINRPDLVHVQRWYELLARRESYRKHVMIPLT